MITAYSNTRSVTTLPEPSFTFWVDTRNTGYLSTASNQYKLQLVSSTSETYLNEDLDIMVEWGDGSVENITAYNQPEVTHTYATEGEYRIRITGGVFGWQTGYFRGDNRKMLNIEKWDGLIISESGCFQSCFNMTVTDTNDPILASTNMASTFESCELFNRPIGHWDMSGVTDISYIIGWAYSFNQPIGDWDTSSVVYMNAPIGGTQAFNQDIGNWDTSSVEEMWGFAYEAYGFNNGGSPSISNWSFPNCTYAEETFSYAKAFNQPLNWYMPQVDSLENWFYRNEGFNSPITMDTSNVTNFYGMFAECKDFNQDINSFDFSNSINANYMFDANETFQNGGVPLNIALNGDAYGMFYQAKYNNPLTLTCIGTNQNIGGMFYGTSSESHPFNQDVTGWDVASVTNFSYMFAFSDFNSPGVDTWNYSTTAYINFGAMFYQTQSFNQPLLAEGSTLLLATTFPIYQMFSYTYAWNNGGQPVADSEYYLNTSTGAMWTNIFYQAKAFNQPINIDFSRFNSINGILQHSLVFDQDISYWDVSNITQNSTLFSNLLGISTNYYDAALIAWAEKLPTVTGKAIGFGASKYTPGGAAEAAREAIIAKGWTIYDGGPA